MSQMAYGSSAAFGPACGKCFKFTLLNTFLSTPPFFPPSETSLVAKITDMCPLSDDGWCSGTESKVNEYVPPAHPASVILDNAGRAIESISTSRIPQKPSQTTSFRPMCPCMDMRCNVSSFKVTITTDVNRTLESGTSAMNKSHVQETGRVQETRWPWEVTLVLVRRALVVPAIQRYLCCPRRAFTLFQTCV